MRNSYFLIAFMLLSCGDYQLELKRQEEEEEKQQHEKNLKEVDTVREKILNFITSKVKLAEEKIAKNTPEEVSKNFQSILETIHQIIEQVINIEKEINRITQIQQPTLEDKEKLKKLKEEYKNILNTDNKQ